MEQNKTRRFLKNALTVALSALAMRTVAVWFGAYVSGKIGKEGMGIYSLVMSVYGFAITLATSGVHLAVTVIRVSLGMIGEEVAFISGRAADTPVIYPYLETYRLACLENVSHNLVVSLPVGVREHMYDDIHIGAGHLGHILYGVRKHSVAVICGTCF